MKKIWKKLLAVTLALSMTMSMVSMTSLAVEEETEETAAPTTYCGIEEHTHSVENGCYKLTCEKTHENTYTLDGDTKIYDEHIHGDGCYATEPSCGKEEHTHSNNCYVSVSWIAETGTLTITGDGNLSLAGGWDGNAGNNLRYTALKTEDGTSLKDILPEKLIIKDFANVTKFGYYQNPNFPLRNLKALTLENVGCVANFNSYSNTTTLMTQMTELNLVEVKKIEMSAFNNMGKPFDPATGEGLMVKIDGGERGTTLFDGAFTGCKFMKMEMSGLVNYEAGGWGYPFANAGCETGAAADRAVIVELHDMPEIPANLFRDCYNMRTVNIANVDNIGKLAFYGCNNLETATLKNVKEIGQQAFYDGRFTTLSISGENVTIGEQAFYWCRYLQDVTLDGVGLIGKNAFYHSGFKQDQLIVKLLNAENTKIGQQAFMDCTSLTAVKGLSAVDWIEGRAFENCGKLDLTEGNADGSYVTALTKLGYSDCFKKYAYLTDRMKDLLDGEFKLADQQKATELTPDGWTSSKTGTLNSTDDFSTQITKEAKWNDDNKTVADVQLKFSHSELPGMDFLFVVDLSDSMTRIGNATENIDSRFYDMQSKLLDVTGELLTKEGYANQVGVVGFGGAYNGKEAEMTSYKFVGDATEMENYLLSLTPFYQNTDYVKALTAAQEMIGTHDSGRDLAVIFISDGMPTVNGTTAINEDNWDAQLAEIKTLADSIKSNPNVKIYGVMESVPASEVQRATEGMKAVCTDGLYFRANNTDEFSEAVNKAIGAAYGTYTVVDKVNSEYFDLDASTIKAPEGTEVKVEGNTITWTIYGLPFKTYTLTFQEKLHADLIDKVGSYNYDTNLGNATVNGDANSVETPVLPRVVDPTYKVVHVYYTNGSEDGRSEVVTVAGKAGETVTAENIDKVTTYGDNSYTFTSADPESLTLTQKENGTITLRYDRTVTTTPTYLVTYSWTGLPDEATQRVPDTRSYYAGTGVRVNTAYTEGTEVTVGETTYVFSGWDTEDFTMPARNVEIKGVWTAKPAEEDVEETDTPTTESPEPTESPDPTESPAPIESPDPTETPNPTETQEPDEGEDLGDNDTPLAENPDEGEDLGDNDTPLAEVPQTGDMLWLWMTLAAGSAVSLAWISAEEKKGKRVSK